MRTLLGSSMRTVLTVLLVAPRLVFALSPTGPPSVRLAQIIETNPKPPIERNPSPPSEKDPTLSIDKNPTPPIDQNPTPPIEQNPSPPAEEQSPSHGVSPGMETQQTNVVIDSNRRWLSGV